MFLLFVLIKKKILFILASNCFHSSDIVISRSQKPKHIKKLAEELQLLPEEVRLLC